MNDDGNGFLVDARGLEKRFPVKAGFPRRTVAEVRAVDGVSFEVRRGRTFGLVGESGCGKTTLARTMVGLYRPTAGSLFFDTPADKVELVLELRRKIAEAGTVRGPAARAELSGLEERLEVLRREYDVYSLPKRKLAARRREFQLVFQDPWGSLDPRMTVGHIVGEGLAVHGIGGSRAERAALVRDTLVSCGLDPDAIDRYPHEFSGGQRQRIGIARALALRPKLLVLDEPVSALDVSIRVQILDLLKDIKEAYGLTYVFIAHDLAVVERVADEVGVMYLGKIVERAARADLFSRRYHPYTRALIDAAPVPDPNVERRRAPVRGEPPSPIAPPPGCRFHPRCPEAVERCRLEEPPLAQAAPGHYVACWMRPPHRAAPGADRPGLAAAFGPGPVVRPTPAPGRSTGRAGGA